MPYFRAICDVSGLQIRTDTGQILGGYFCTVVFEAPDDTLRALETGALTAARQHASRNRFFLANKDLTVTNIRLDDCWQISLFSYIWRRFILYDAGGTFYPIETQ